MMKRILSVLLALVLALAMLGCRSRAELPGPAPSAAEPVQELPSPQSGEPEELAPDNAQAPPVTEDEPADTTDAASAPDEHGVYDSKEDVALYLHLYGHLPENYITKKEAEALGWSGGSLEPYAPGRCIGGGRFGNYEGLLPDAAGRRWTECDIDTLGAKSRGAKRIVFSNDGLIYYTGDHYASFELLYGEE